MTTSPLATVRTVADLRAHVAAWRREGLRVALVPTMGALHAGHLSLVSLARTRADRVIASVFVNPAQFGPNEDFAAYPRDEAGDAAQLAAGGCDLLFAPAASEIYPPGFATTVTTAGISESMEGLARPGHFAGVATVVSKLLIQAAPDVAVFGEKDYQQLQVIRRVAIDLDLPVEIVGAPTARAEDGLALSSRNAYLTAEERRVAGELNVIMARAAGRIAAGDDIAAAEVEGRAAIKAAGFARIDYFETRAADDLRRLGPGVIDAPGRLLAAVLLGRTRLLDNRAI